MVERLRRALVRLWKRLRVHERNIDVWDNEFRKAIENVTGHKAEDVTDCNIWVSLTKGSPRLTILEILANLKEGAC